MSLKRVAAAVFVKTPGYSPLKTRLAAGLGKSTAEEFHRLAAMCIAETLQRVSRLLVSQGVSLTPCWAVAEEAAMHDPLWSDLQTISQGNGSLGARMHFVYSHLLDSHDAVLLLGADSPQISPRILSEAVTSLGGQEFVLGPADDGGFYLLGGRRPIPLSVWDRVPYSVPETARCMVLELAALGKVAHIESLIDVDVLHDLEGIVPALREFPPASIQQQLAAWIREQLKTEN